MEEVLWDGKSKIERGHIVTVHGCDIGSSYYNAIPEGQKATVIGHDMQQNCVPVLLIRWYDLNSVIRLDVVTENNVSSALVTSEAQRFSDVFYEVHNIRLSPRNVQAVLDKLAEPEQNVSQDKMHEITLLSSAGCEQLEILDFPITLKLASDQFKVDTDDEDMVGISTHVLSCLLSLYDDAEKLATRNSHWWFLIPTEATFTKPK